MDKLEMAALANLSVSEKAKRMDDFLEELRREKNPSYDRQFDLMPFVAPITTTSIFINHRDQTKLVWIAFDFILQTEFSASYGEWQNTLHDSILMKQRGWQSPRIQVAYRALTQAQIISSRIEFERLMRFVYYAFEGEELQGDSTYSSFKSWVLSKGSMSSLAYLLPYMSVSRLHDKNFRTAEVHTGSKLKSKILALLPWDTDEEQKAIELRNCIINLWRPIVELLDNRRPSSAVGVPGLELAWIGIYVESDPDKLQGFYDIWSRKV